MKWMESTQALRLPGFQGSSRGVCWSQRGKAQASRWLLAEFASLLALALESPADVDVREPRVVLVELGEFGDGLSVALGFWVVRAGLLAWGMVNKTRAHRYGR